MANPKKKKKNLFYRRASWDFQFDDNYNYKTLEEYLIDAHAMLCNVNERSCTASSSSILCAKDKITKDDGIFLQIVTCNPGSDTSTISSDHKSPNIEVFSEPAPSGKDYLQGDIFVLVKGNHVILCPSGTREGTATKYFLHVFTKLNKTDIATSFDLDIIANIDKLKLIKTEGVKEILLNASIYEASKSQLESEDRSFSSLLPNITHEIIEIFSTDKDLNEIKESENLNISLSIKFDGNEARKNKKKNINFGDAGLKRLNKSSEMLLKDSDKDSNFEIITHGGNSITSHEIKTHGSYDIDVHGKSINTDKAWDALLSYYKQLKENGTLEQ